jgi:hypothetical protein
MLWLGYQGVEHTARHGGYDIVPYITNQSQTLAQTLFSGLQGSIKKIIFRCVKKTPKH